MLCESIVGIVVSGMVMPTNGRKGQLCTVQDIVKEIAKPLPLLNVLDSVQVSFSIDGIAGSECYAPLLRQW